MFDYVVLSKYEYRQSTSPLPYVSHVYFLRNAARDLLESVGTDEEQHCANVLYQTVLDLSVSWSARHNNSTLRRAKRFVKAAARLWSNYVPAPYTPQAARLTRRLARIILWEC